MWNELTDCRLITIGSDIYSNAFFSSVGQNKMADLLLTVQMAIYREHFYLSHIFRD